MPFASFLVVLSIAALVQALGGSTLWFAGGRPDLVLLLAASWSILRGTHEGSLAGVGGGLLLDLFSATPFGLNAALLGLMGLVTGLGEGSLS